MKFSIDDLGFRIDEGHLSPALSPSLPPSPPRLRRTGAGSRRGEGDGEFTIDDLGFRIDAKPGRSLPAAWISVCRPGVRSRFIGTAFLAVGTEVTKPSPHPDPLPSHQNGSGEGIRLRFASTRSGVGGRQSVIESGVTATALQDASECGARPNCGLAADLEIRDTADLEVCATRSRVGQSPILNRKSLIINHKSPIAALGMALGFGTQGGFGSRPQIESGVTATALQDASEWVCDVEVRGYS